MGEYKHCVVQFSEWFLHWEIMKTEQSNISACKYIQVNMYMLTDIFENIGCTSVYLLQHFSKSETV